MQCPYCKEEIKDEAIKCKHCGEWLENKSPEGNLLDLKSFDASDLKNSVSSFYKSIFGSNEIKNPTNSDPLEIKTFHEKVLLCGDFFIHKGKKISYDEIKYYSSDSESMTMNFVLNMKEIAASIYYGDIPKKEDADILSDEVSLGSFSMYLTTKKQKGWQLTYIW